MQDRIADKLLNVDATQIVCLHKDEVSRMMPGLKERGFVIYHLDGLNVTDETSLIHELVTKIPCDPNYYQFAGGEPNWSAVEDSIFGGIDGTTKRLALIWENADKFIVEDLNYALLVVELLLRITTLRKVVLKVVFLGESPVFTHIVG